MPSACPYRRIAALALLTLLLAACGSKGPLVKPQPGSAPAPTPDATDR